MARPEFNAQGTPPKLSCKAAEGDCDMRVVKVRRNATTGVIESNDWQCKRSGCERRKTSKF